MEGNLKRPSEADSLPEPGGGDVYENFTAVQREILAENVLN
jgi:hypothetical protein